MKQPKPWASRPGWREWPVWARALPLVAAVAFGAGFLSNVPDVQWRLMLWSARLRDRFITTDLYLPTPAPVTLQPAAASTGDSPQTPAVTPTVVLTPSPRLPTPTPVPLPESATLDGFRYEAQKPNACGPATLAVTLSYFGWTGTQADILPHLKPKLWDKNVRPDEMLGFVEQTGLRAVSRVNGTLDDLKRFVSAGYPVIVQKGVWLNDREGWVGHYVTVNAYDDATGQFTTQDTFQGRDLKVGYQRMLDEWRAFNYTHLVVYRPEDELKVMGLLGEAADAEWSALRALERAAGEAAESEGDPRAFALFNQGSSLVSLYRYGEAVLAYDDARRAGLPWRMLWYQTGPYKAYFYSGRYHDVIELANATLARTGGLEESLYWRGQAKQAIGDPDGAVADYREALKSNPNFGAAIAALEYLGHAP